MKILIMQSKAIGCKGAKETAKSGQIYLSYS